MTRQAVNRTLAGQAIEDLIVEIVATFFLLRAEGMRIGVVSPSGEGYWSVLRILKMNGAQTVPQIARYRYVPRQSIQKLANEMLEDGVIELVNNPAHKRSKLLRLTPKGDAVFQELSDRIATLSETLAEQGDAAQLQNAVGVVKHLHAQLRAMLNQ
ncbi:MarR family winged helix-turn-helix transcriptional regulator [Gloeocapsopsis dulcis]|uniref:MarR family transcriptional regulator n=1 Tax=Gloeocapsopsis dulcis AAB1 = 1H9 TaxID=1433147 RepID=A0A6N8G2W7_9CHRO|nr:MarR family transcriptional regulator [Gloeocapsopsis dulcis]MUL38885.1 MarR family transcriptional regulator [Gloeocapsopsis dulcis AAB1 = 1H9]WNN90504.1 MarR family transcriptional regulator [Gloeocapsopsis dulcis]